MTTGELLGLHTECSDKDRRKFLAENHQSQKERLVKLVSEATAEFYDDLSPSDFVVDVRLDVSLIRSGGDVDTMTSIKR